MFPHFPSLFFPPPHPIHNFPFLHPGSHAPPPPSIVKQEPESGGQEADESAASGASTPWQTGVENNHFSCGVYDKVRQGPKQVQQTLQT